MSTALRTLLLASDAVRDRMRPALREVPFLQLIGEVPGGEEGVHFATLCQPDVVVVGMDDGAIALVRRLQSVAPWARLVALGTPSEAERVSLLQAGVGDVLPDVEPGPLVACLERYMAPREATLEGEPGTGGLVAVWSPKGGAGRSTLASNLAIALFRSTGRETVLVDGAFAHGELDLHLNLPVQQGLELVLQGARIENALAPHPTGVKLLGGVRQAEVGAEAWRGLLQRLRRRDAWTVVDAHPLHRGSHEATLELADRVLVPLPLDLAAVRALQRDMAAWRDSRIDPSRWEIVAWGGRGDLSVQDASQTLRRPIAWHLPSETVAARRAINQGIPLVQAEPRGAYARELSRVIGGGSTSTALVPVTSPLAGLMSWFRGGPATRFGA